MTEQQPESVPAPEGRTRPPKAAWYRRRWPQVAGGLILGLILGGACAAPGDSTTTTTANGPTATPTVTVTASPAGNTVSLAEAHLAEQQARDDERQKLAVKTQKLQQRSAALDKREKQISGAEAAAKASEFPGEGTFLVGADVQPGTYRGGGSGCYWARLSGTSGGFNDIITNGNVEGPTVVTIAASDKAFETSGCGTWKKIG